ERDELTRLNSLLRSEVGGALDIGGIDIGRISGRVEAAGAHIGPIHLDARLPDTLFAGMSADYLADEDLIAPFRARTRRPPPLSDLGRQAEVNLSVGGITMEPDPDGGSVLRLPPGRLPTAAVLRRRLAALGPRVDPTIRQRVETATRLTEVAEEF